MNTYVCEFIKDGIECYISYECASHEKAEAFAEKNGWSYLGRYVETDVYDFTMDTTSVH